MATNLSLNSPYYAETCNK